MKRYWIMCVVLLAVVVGLDVLERRSRSAAVCDAVSANSQAIRDVVNEAYGPNSVEPRPPVQLPPTPAFTEAQLAYIASLVNGLRSQPLQTSGTTDRERVLARIPVRAC